MIRFLLGAAAAATLPLLAARFGLAHALGAHPWWATQTVLSGVALGLPLALLTRCMVPRRWLAPGAGLLMLASFGLATLGKARFAATFGEDQLAGQLWYFGWIGAGFFLTTALVGLLVPAMRPRFIRRLTS